MIGVMLLVASILALVFGSIWAARAWGAGACVGLALPGGLLILFVPFGTVVVILASLVVMTAAQKRLFQRVADGEVDPDPPAWGFQPGYPHPHQQSGPGLQSQGGPAPPSPGLCPVCHQATVQWRADLDRWFCRPCKEPR